MNTKKIKKILPLIVLLFIIIVPVLTFAQGFIVCGGVNSDGSKQHECGYGDLLVLVNTIINWIIVISVPVAAGVFAWAGFTYMTTGISDQKSYAKDMMVKVFIGFVAILSAWIIVTTITNALLSDGSNNGGTNFKTAVPVEGVK